MQDRRLTQHGDIALARARFVMLCDLTKQGMDAIDSDALGAAGEILHEIAEQATHAECAFTAAFHPSLDEEITEAEENLRPLCVPHLKL